MDTPTPHISNEQPHVTVTVENPCNTAEISSLQRAIAAAVASHRETNGRHPGDEIPALLRVANSILEGY